MLSDLDRKMCQKHKLEILTIDLKQSTTDEDKFLCLKCLMERIDIQNIALVEDTKIMIKQMKNLQLNNKIKVYQRRIENFKYIESQVNEMKESINYTIDKLQHNLNWKINLVENELDDIESKTILSTFDEDVSVLSKNYKGSFNFEIPKEFEQQLDDNSYIDSIERQLQSIINCPNIIEIKECLEKTKVEIENDEVKQFQLLNKKEENPEKTPSLKIQCDKHRKEIIMLNLNPDKTKLSRLACVECIQSNNPIKYTTLGDANIKWNEYLGQTSEQIKRFQNQRYLNSSQIIDILQEIKEEYNSAISEIINKVNTQYQMFYKNETKKIKDNIIFQMNIEQINELTEILSQNDKFEALIEKQFNIQKQDLNQIATNFAKLIQNDLVAAEKINNIFKESSLNMSNVKDLTNEIVLDDKNSIQNLQEIKQLNFQVQHFKIYKDIFMDGLNQYDFIIQTISSLSNQFKDLQSQQFNEYVSKIKKDFSLIQKFYQFDQITQELRKHDSEQINIINGLMNENENQSIKLEEFEQQKISCEVIIQEKQAELQACQEINQKNEEIIQTLQKTLVQLFSQSLTFSKTYKHTDCSVTQNRKVIETSRGGCFKCCVCDQVIPQNGVIQFAFKIIEISNIMIGIGFRSIVQSKGYRECYSIRGGTYNLQYDGRSWNHDQQEKDGKSVAFPFSKNDIIIIEVDIQKKYVKWIKQSTNESFTLTIDTSKDLYPCVHLWGTCKVEILNQVFK